jgi:cytochrome b6-f complex iron-sulfur subunit
MQQRTEQKIEPEKPRRDFLGKLWLILGVLALAEIIGVVIAYFRPRKARIKPADLGSIIEGGSVEKFPLNSVTAFVRGKFYLSRLEDGGFLALSRKCTHLGCTVPWDSKEEKFVCPCHSSIYDIRGEVVSPPAPRALDMYRVSIENNVVKVDISKPIKRSQFRKDQVVYPRRS